MICPVSSGNPDILLDYSARRLSPEVASVLTRHLEICPDCSRFSEAQREVWHALDAWDAAEFSANFDERLYARIDADSRRSLWSRLVGDHFAWKPAVSVAGALATVAVAVFLTDPQARLDRGTAVPVTEKARTEALEPEQVERTLEDLDMLRQLSASGAGAITSDSHSL